LIKKKELKQNPRQASLWLDQAGYHGGNASDLYSQDIHLKSI
jgi:hypothetical protein